MNIRSLARIVTTVVARRRARRVRSQRPDVAHRVGEERISRRATPAPRSSSSRTRSRPRRTTPRRDSCSRSRCWTRGDAVGAETEARKALQLGYPPDEAYPVLARALLAQGEYREGRHASSRDRKLATPEAQGRGPDRDRPRAALARREEGGSRRDRRGAGGEARRRARDWWRRRSSRRPTMICRWR